MFFSIKTDGDEMKNNFLPIPDAPGYEVNSQGFVRNIRTGKILKPNDICGRKKTPAIHIPKYHIRRTAESLRRQAVVFHKENGKNISWLEIPNFGGLYEINNRGVVRNTHTKKIKKTRLCNGTECVMLILKGKSVSRGINSLLWEVHGIIRQKQHPRICSVTIEKENERRYFEKQKDCIEFLSQREFYSKDYVRKKLNNRVEKFCEWKIFYKEIF